MDTVFEKIQGFYIDQGLWFAGLFVAFTALAYVWPAVAGQKILRHEWRTDVAYYFGISLVYLPLTMLIMTFLILAFYPGDGAMQVAVLNNGRAPVNEWPIALQFVAYLFIAEIAEYTLHRTLHTNRYWRWHALHHMPKELDWLSHTRFHPVNILLKLALINSVIMIVGFSPELFLYHAPFIAAYAGLVHANLNWNFGPLGYVFASPTFHRWHHTSPEYGGNKNFSQVVVFMDHLFGTFYMPKHLNPNEVGFGVNDAIPENSVWGQIAFPFKEGRPKTKKAVLAAAPVMDESEHLPDPS